MARIRPVMERYRVTCDDIWLSVFEKAGLPAKRALMLMDLNLSVVRGMGLNRMWRHNDLNDLAYLKDWIAIANQQCLSRFAISF